MSQTTMILTHLKSGQPLMPLQALRMFGTMRLAARVADLRRQGVRIKTELLPVRSGKRVACYRLTR